jgi:hypothetical protein
VQSARARIPPITHGLHQQTCRTPVSCRDKKRYLEHPWRIHKYTRTQQYYTALYTRPMRAHEPHPKYTPQHSAQKVSQPSAHSIPRLLNTGPVLGCLPVAAQHAEHMALWLLCEIIKEDIAGFLCQGHRCCRPAGASRQQGVQNKTCHNQRVGCSKGTCAGGAPHGQLTGPQY